MAQALQDILKELDAGYNPSRDLINKQLAALPSAGDAQIASLDAKKDVAFNDITSGARDRGIGFSGIPLSEQAKYVSTDYLPAVANVKTSLNQNKTSLLGALNDINLDQRKTALGIRQTQQDRDFQKAQADAAQRASAKAAAAQAASLAALYGGNSQPAPTPPKIDKIKAQAQSDVSALLKSKNSTWILKNAVGIYKSAKNGNALDQAKYQLLKHAAPQFFGANGAPQTLKLTAAPAGTSLLSMGGLTY